MNQPTSSGPIVRWGAHQVECLRCFPEGGKLATAVGVRGPRDEPPQRFCEDGHPVDNEDGWFETAIKDADFEL